MRSSKECTREESELCEFVSNVWSAHARGYVFVAAKRSTAWIEECLDIEEVTLSLPSWIARYSTGTFDLYFCPNAFSQRKRQTQFALPTPYAWCDIDDGDPASFDPQPSILIETSPGRHQGFWRFDTKAEPIYAEAVSKHLAYSFGGDKNGWSSTKMLRVPFTTNHKPTRLGPPVRLIRWANDAYKDWPIVVKPPPLLKRHTEIKVAANAEEIIRRYAKKIEPKYVSLMRHRSVLSFDRSRCIFMIVAALYHSGATLDEIATVLWCSPYFIDKYGANANALEKEVSRITAKLDWEGTRQ